MRRRRSSFYVDALQSSLSTPEENRHKKKTETRKANRNAKWDEKKYAREKKNVWNEKATNAMVADVIVVDETVIVLVVYLSLFRFKY